VKEARPKDIEHVRRRLHDMKGLGRLFFLHALSRPVCQQILLE
jgi:hypothetical protein